METLDDLANIISEKQDIALLSHVVPDGDAIGSILALGLGLIKSGWNVQMINPDGVPEMYEFLPGSSLVSRDFAGPAEISIFLDCSNLKRVGKLRHAVDRVNQIINIDHHTSNSFFGDYDYVDASASASGEIVYQLLKKLDIEVDPEMATCIYTAIVTDTGSFQYESTTNKTHLVASDLLLIGADLNSVRYSLWENTPIKDIKLLTKALNTLDTDASGKVAWMSLTYDIFKAYGGNNESTEGFVNYPKSIKGVEIGVFFKEFEPNRIKVGMRSKTQVDVNKLAYMFGGGGHKRAAGCIFEGSLDEAERSIINQAVKLFE